MPATGNHRRRNSSSLTRGFIAVSAGEPLSRFL